MGLFVQCAGTGKGPTLPNCESGIVRRGTTSAVGSEAVERAEAETKSSLPIEALCEMWGLWNPAHCRNEQGQAEALCELLVSELRVQGRKGIKIRTGIDFVRHLGTLRPDTATVTQFPAIAADVWSRRQGDSSLMVSELTARLEEQKKLKAELLRARLRGEVSQADYAQANVDFDHETEGVAQQIHALRLRRGTLDAFLAFSKLMLVDVAAAWQRADAEQRLRVQNFLFRDGVAYHQEQKFLNTTNLTSFQQPESLDSPRKIGWRPRRDLNPRYRRERALKSWIT